MDDLLDQYLVRVTNHFPNFVRFGEDKSFDATERDYKEELVGVFEQSVASLIRHFEDGAGKGQVDLGKAITRLFTKPLKNMGNKPQNLVAWQIVDLLTKFDDAANIQWAQLVRGLTDGNTDLSKRVDSFVEGLKSLFSGKKVAFPSLSRSVTSFLLMLSDPKQHAVIKTQAFNRALKFFGQKPMPEEPLTGDEYLRIQEFLFDIENRLAAKGLSPRDLIDVQSFIWVGDSKSYESPQSPDNGGTKKPNEPGINKLNHNLNRILYGPPGTGKTYRSVAEAVAIIEGEDVNALLADYSETKRRFDGYRSNGQIEFVTFHPSYSYQDFIQGIRPSTTLDGRISYGLEPGVLRRIADAASENWKAAGKEGFTDEMQFERAFSKVLSDIDEAEEGCIKVKLFRGFESEVRAGVQERSLVMTLPGYPTIYNLAKHQLKTLWARRNEIKKPSDIKVYHRSMFWAALQLLKETNTKLLPPEILPVKQQRYVLVIDEINRGNIAKIFGELITLIEDDKRLGESNQLKVRLPYSPADDEEFGLPPNLHLLGTMNTADRSIALLDTALRRRFHFTEMMPDVSALPVGEIDGIDLRKLLETINKRVEFLFDRDHAIGHAYFCGVKNFEDLRACLKFKVIPLLQEYFYDDWSRIRLILGGLVDEKRIEPDNKLFKGQTNLQEKLQYEVTEITLDKVKAIYE